MKQIGLFWHVHHGILLEWCHSYNERAVYIRMEKEASELVLRLRLFRPVKGNLPDDVQKAGSVCGTAWAVFVETRAARDKAEAALDAASSIVNSALSTGWNAAILIAARSARDGARVAYQMSQAVCDEAQASYSHAANAFDRVCVEHRPAIEALHKAECPDCPWDGHTIFPEA